MDHEPDRNANVDPQVAEAARLLDRVAARDELAFACLYDLFARPLFSVALKILQDQSAAEEVVQEAFTQIWERAGTYDPQCGKPLTWAIVLTRNRAIDRLRSRQRFNRLVESYLELGPAALTETRPVSGGELVARESVDTVRRALNELPADQRQAIELAFFLGLTQSEIAAQQSLPLGTVKARIRRGLLFLRARMERDGHTATTMTNLAYE